MLRIMAGKKKTQAVLNIKLTIKGKLLNQLEGATIFMKGRIEIVAKAPIRKMAAKTEG